MAAVDLSLPTYHPLIKRGTTPSTIGNLRLITLPETGLWTLTIYAPGSSSLKLVAGGAMADAAGDDAAIGSADYLTIPAGGAFDLAVGRGWRGRSAVFLGSPSANADYELALVEGG